jgi:UDP-N-acetylglucosamine--N-acetylmuramyl-(pentapeptide) pyrophosphoryl-undecaprenol N-acetylglucosamine transferase
VKKNRIIITGGGTGGHIYPGIAIGKYLKNFYPQNKILFVGAFGKMEMKRIPKEGFKIKGLWISGLNRKKWWKNFFLPLKILVSLFQAILIWIKFRPNIMIGTGGYASLPILIIGSIFQTKIVIQEQNYLPGISNKILSRFATIIAVAYENMERFFPQKKIILTGNPVRNSLIESNLETEKNKGNSSLNKNGLNLLILGGSLGSEKINEVISKNIFFFKKNKINVTWQCGKNYYERFKTFESSHIKIFPFLEQIENFYNKCDIIISRAGALTISELCIIGKPSILIPSPNVSENHQYHNAKYLQDKKAAIMIEEKKIKKEFIHHLENLLISQEKRVTLSKAISQLARPNATHEIVLQINKILASG